MALKPCVKICCIASREEAQSEFFHRYRGTPSEVLRQVFRRHGARAAQVMGDGDLGEHYGAGLTRAEVDYLQGHEWAQSADDILWRRTKIGLHMTHSEKDALTQAIDAQRAAAETQRADRSSRSAPASLST